MMRDYSSLFNAADEQVKRRRIPFGAGGPQDMFAGSQQHAQAVAEQAQGGGVMGQIAGAVGAVGQTVGDIKAARAADRYAGLGTGDTAPPPPPPQFAAGTGSGAAGDPEPEVDYGPPPPPPAAAPAHANLFGGANASSNPGGTPVPGLAVNTSTTGGYWNSGSGDVSEFQAKPISAPGAVWERPTGTILDPGYDQKAALQEDPPSKFWKPLGYGGARRYGGRVEPGYQYRVNEDGTEMFVPDVPGTIIPNPSTGATSREDWRQNATPPQPAAQPAVSGGMTQSMAVSDEFGNQPADVATQNPRALSPREAAMQRINQTIEGGTEPFKKSSIWKRVGKGLLAGMQRWGAAGAPGGLAGLVGAAGAGAAVYGASKGAQGEGDYRDKLGQLFGEYQRAAAPEMAEQERLKGVYETQKKGLDVRHQQIENVLAQYGPYIDTLKQQKMTSEQAAAELRRVGVPMEAFDAREFKLLYDSRGLPSAMATTGAPVAVPAPGVPVNDDAKRFPTTVTGPDGVPMTVPASAGQALSASTNMAQANATAGYRAQEQKDRQEERLYRRGRDTIEDNWKAITLGVQQENQRATQQLALLARQQPLIESNGKMKQAYGEMVSIKNSLDDLIRSTEPAPGAPPMTAAQKVDLQAALNAKWQEFYDKKAEVEGQAATVTGMAKALQDAGYVLGQQTATPGGAAPAPAPAPALGQQLWAPGHRRPAARTVLPRYEPRTGSGGYRR